MKIINCGALNIDYVYSVDHMVQKGETLSSYSMEIFCGGKGLNQSIALSRSGTKVYHAGMAGRENGGILVEELRKAGVHTELISFVEESSGHAIIQRDKEGENCILLYGGANRSISKAWIDRLSCQFEKGDYLLLQNEISEIAYLMDKGKQAGMTLIFNPSPMDEKIKEYPLSLVDYFILNRIEAEGICGESAGEEELMHSLKERFPEAGILLTLGEQGCIFTKEGKTIRQKSYSAKAVDTTAAGDTFTGYFLGGLLGKLAVEAALDRAARAAAIAVSRKGAASSIPEAWEIDGEK